jgi:hypothetical protein
MEATMDFSEIGAVFNMDATAVAVCINAFLTWTGVVLGVMDTDGYEREAAQNAASGLAADFDVWVDDRMRDGLLPPNQ